MTARRFTRAAAAALAAILTVASLPAAFAHAPDPALGGALFAKNQNVRFKWRAGQEPPGSMQTAIKAAATGSNGSRASNAAVFTYDPAGSSWINYGLDVGCGVNGIACFSRVNAPNSFTMSFREQGHVFDWGKLQWCQFSTNPPDGCFDAENVALDEFGHVEILGHHQNYSDNRDYLDAVVQTVSRTKPKAGWNAHVYGRCDVATLQRKYGVPSFSTKVSTCLDLVTTVTIVPSATYLSYGGGVTFTASLKVADTAAYEQLRLNPLSGRTVVLQRRPVGGTTWSTVATMASGSTAGTYVSTASSQTTSAEWRAVFPKPSVEGLRGAASALVKVTVSSCTGRSCPIAAPAGGAIR